VDFKKHRPDRRNETPENKAKINGARCKTGAVSSSYSGL